MHASGYLDQKRQYPLGMVLAVGINAAAVASLWLARNDYLPPIEDILVVEPIPIDEPDPAPLPPPPAPADHAAPPRPAPVDAPTPVIPIADPGPRAVLRPVEPIELTGLGAGIPRPVIPAPLPILTDASIDPRFADDFQPPYPAGKQRLGEEGTVVVRVLIGADGRVERVERVSGADGAFFEATERQALRRWRFRPATRDGVPIESWRTMAVRFEMRG